MVWENFPKKCLSNKLIDLLFDFFVGRIEVFFIISLMFSTRSQNIKQRGLNDDIWYPQLKWLHNSLAIKTISNFHFHKSNLLLPVFSEFLSARCSGRMLLNCERLASIVKLCWRRVFWAKGAMTGSLAIPRCEVLQMLNETWLLTC